MEQTLSGLSGFLTVCGPKRKSRLVDKRQQIERVSLILPLAWESLHRLSHTMSIQVDRGLTERIQQLITHGVDLPDVLSFPHLDILPFSVSMGTSIAH